VNKEKSMTYLFSDAGRAALHGFIDCTTLFAFDLDGTLAPIVADPGGIVIPCEIRRRMISLDRLANLAVITGRSRADALAHLGFSPRYLVGNHGAEGLPGGDGQEEEFVRLCRSWREQLDGLLPDVNSAGIVIEDKDVTLSLHYRNASDRDQSKRELLNAICRLVPAPRRVSGKFVENLIPVAAQHKGEALMFLMAHAACSRALFVGDDVTDEDVFRLRNDNIFCIRIGKNTTSAARFYLREQSEVGALFDEIISMLDSCPGKHSLAIVA
jgi:trehalose 6-phosphate phosphatase